MCITQILRKIQALPAKEQKKLFGKLSALTAPDVPESFCESMAQAARGELMDFDVALAELNRK